MLKMTLPTIKAVKNWKEKVEKLEEGEDQLEADEPLILKPPDPSFKYSLTKKKANDNYFNQ